MEIKGMQELNLTITRDGLGVLAVYYRSQRLMLSDEDLNDFELMLEDKEQQEAHDWSSAVGAP